MIRSLTVSAESEGEKKIENRSTVAEVMGN